MFSRRSFLLLPTFSNVKIIQQKNSPAIYKNEFKSNTRDFKFTTLLKDDDKSIAIHQIVEWYDPILMEHKTRENFDVYLLDVDII